MGKPTSLLAGSWRAVRGAPLAYQLLNEVFHTEYIGVEKQTRGLETSKYPEERTSTETPVVVASERGPGLVTT